MSRAGTWISAMRPKTLAAGAAPVIIGTAMAFEAAAGHAPSAFAALFGAVLIQIGTNFANDYFDFVKGADTAARIGPVRATAAGLVRPETMRRAMILAFALVFVPGSYILYRGSWPFLAVGLVSIVCGVLYTGGPWPLAYLGLGDLFVLVFFGPVAVGGTYYLQAGALPEEVVWAGVAAGLFSTAILTVNNLRDIEGDRAARKRTLAVRFGRGVARAEYAIAILLGGAGIPMLLAMRYAHAYVALAALAVLPAIPCIRIVWTSEDGPALNGVLAKTGQLLLLFAVLFSIGWSL